MKNYDQILNPIRAKGASEPKRDKEKQFVSDRSRIIFSSCFRRLQQKAQVFSLEGNTTVRSRMTHTLEVAHIGNSISKKIAEEFLNKKIDDKDYSIFTQEIARVVETACLMHDIGNPPFGHFGEIAIQNWFKKNGISICKKHFNEEQLSFLKEKMLPDFYHFEGNCQGFRIFTSIQWDFDQYALNLSYPQLATYLKYLESPYEEEKKGKDADKPGYFYSEENKVEDIWDKLKIKPKHRFPLVYIMEAADDIAYCFSDFEDGMEKEIITQDIFKQLLIEEWDRLVANKNEIDKNYLKERLKMTWDKVPEKSDIGIAKFLKFKTNITSQMVAKAAEVYVEEHSNIFNGLKKDSLLSGQSEEVMLLKALKKVAIRSLYTSKPAENVEIAGNKILNGLLESFKPLLEMTKTDFLKLVYFEKEGPSKETNILERRLYNQLADKYKKAYQYAYENNCKGSENEGVMEWFYRAHLVIDHIAGMTDDYALKSYQLYSGIEIN